MVILQAMGHDLPTGRDMPWVGRKKRREAAGWISIRWATGRGDAAIPFGDDPELQAGVTW